MPGTETYRSAWEKTIRAAEVTNEPGGHRYLYDDVRMVATGTLNAINKTWLRISMNPATGNGGTCYGDSGGPNFLSVSGQPVLVAVTIRGDAVCRATNVVYRRRDGGYGHIEPEA